MESKRPGAQLRVAELAARCGVSVRTVRFYHQAGVLPRPRLEGRTGWYDEQHVERLAFVRRLQDRGYSLAAISDMIAAQVPDGLGAAEGMRLSRRQLETMVPSLLDRPELVDGDMVRFGLLRPDPDADPDADPGAHPDADRGGAEYEVTGPALLRAGVALVARGVPVQEAVAELGRLRDELGAIAERFALIFERDLLPGRVEPGTPLAVTARQLLDELLPAVLVTTGNVLQEALTAAVERRIAAGSAGQ